MSEAMVSAWRDKLEELQEGSSISAAALLSLMAGEADEDFEEALFLLTQKNILLRVEDLPSPKGSQYATKQLAMEAKLAKNGFLLRDLSEKDPLHLFLKEISSMPAQPNLSWADVKERLEDKDREKIAESFMPRIAARAKALAGRGVLIMDLVQEGSLGIWQGLSAWCGQPLEEYLDRCAVMAMHRAITQQARQDGIGGELRSRLEEYKKTDTRLLGILGRNPTVEEIAREMELELDVAETLDKMLRDAMDAGDNSPKEAEDAEEAVDVDATAYYQLRQRIADLLAVLPEDQKRLLNLRFGLETGKPLDIDSTARLLGISREEALKKEEIALSKLREEEEKL